MQARPSATPHTPSPPADAAPRVAPSVAPVPEPDVPFSGISGIRRIHEDGTVTWHVCLSAQDRTGIARGPDFKGAMAAALADLAERRPRLVE